MLGGVYLLHHVSTAPKSAFEGFRAQFFEMDAETASIQRSMKTELGAPHPCPKGSDCAACNCAHCSTPKLTQMKSLQKPKPTQLKSSN